MSDVVKATVVLHKASDQTQSDCLILACPGPEHLRVLNCRPAGTPARGDRPEWEYEEKNGRLHIHPSLLCPDSGFHTAYNWDAAYEICPPNTSQYELYYKLNPLPEEKNEHN